MIKPILHPTVVFRVPRFSYNEPLGHNWDDLKECIRISSPEFYSIIRQMTFQELSVAEKKIQLTVRKYYNRASLRSTPYGLFATVGTADMNWNGTGIKLTNETQVHSFPDWQGKSALSTAIDLPEALGLLLFSNSTFYCVGDEIRYIRKIGNDHEIAAIDNDPFVLSILKICSSPKSMAEIGKQLTELDHRSLQHYITDLLDIELLLTSAHPNIIGQDYFSRIGQLTGPHEKTYIISGRKAVNGQLDQKLFKYLPDLAMLMQRILEPDKNNTLDEFKERFTRKFEQAEIPIMTALDPETGVGYGRLEKHYNDTLLEALFDDKKKEAGLPVYDDDELRQALYKQIIDKSINGGSINLEELVKQDPKFLPLPNSFNALCTIVDETLFLDSLGGATGTALLGRFALAIEDVRKHCMEIAEMEQACNPEVLLFDVGYTKEDSVDNINRRPSMYRYQLNILNFDTSENPLCVNDILISVQKGKVLLRSRASGKRLVPRFASAYNFKRSDMPLFRLLMDIQSQDVQTSLMFRPWALIPNLSFYPRIRFRNVIVSPATWLLHRSVIKDISGWEQKCNALSDHLQSRISCAYIKTGTADQLLLLDSRKRDDIEMLLSMLEKKEHLYLEEAFLPESPVVTDDCGRPFLPQVAITLTHANEILRPLQASGKEIIAPQNKQWISPGSDWLYFEIYCNPFRSDSILANVLKPYLKKNNGPIHFWFFIRYNENGDHIRLRLKLKDIRMGYKLIAELSVMLEEHVQAGTVSDIRVCTYKKELHRYSAALMEDVEKHFNIDSRFVLSIVGRMSSDFAKYHLCLGILDQIIGSSIMNEKVIDNTLEMVAANLKTEHDLGSGGFKKMNSMFKKFLLAEVPEIGRYAEGLYKKMNDSLITLLTKCPEASRPALLADLFHMHVNRLFINNQRVHEMVIYDFYLLMRKRRDNMHSKQLQIAESYMESNLE